MTDRSNAVWAGDEVVVDDTMEALVDESLYDLMDHEHHVLWPRPLDCDHDLLPSTTQPSRAGILLLNNYFRQDGIAQ